MTATGQKPVKTGGSQISRILEAFERGARHSTEAARMADVPEKAARARICELRSMGILIPTGTLRCRKGGRALITYRLK